MKTIDFASALILLMISVNPIPVFSQNQIEIDSAIGTGRDALHIKYATDDGIHLNSAGGDGIYVGVTGDHGVTICEAGEDGVQVLYAGDDGVFVNYAVGWSLNILGSKDLEATPSGHIAQIYNFNTGTSPDVLALKVGTMANPNVSSNFITFFKGDDVAVGRIEGNNAGGVSYGTSGADYAECLPRLKLEEVLEPGDVVGVHQGKVSRRTDGATQLMVITERPAVLGNQLKEDSDLYEKVSFLGQVRVRVLGAVRSGDWIVASGREDGTGLAVSTDDLSISHRIVGRAWEDNPDPGSKRVNTVVGLDLSEAKNDIIRKMQDQIILMNQQIEMLQNLVLQNHK